MRLGKKTARDCAEQVITKKRTWDRFKTLDMNFTYSVSYFYLIPKSTEGGFDLNLFYIAHVSIL